ncbi:hypothetical protein HELRODRAFT_169033 [Helobdella robusta]|uniref:Uncharacterized protein n=1 Tax=Helobdella robusta TaxID=6412 RepID=T1F1A2_HELRO|nr:hypothetical protein HELRODRAFT_169033 [Helobdella robusta]ESO09092.1 hypothetical protein HELRODRAFT_169033 [Helobdella robusta]
MVSWTDSVRVVVVSNPTALSSVPAVSGPIMWSRVCDDSAHSLSSIKLNVADLNFSDWLTFAENYEIVWQTDTVTAVMALMPMEMSSVAAVVGPVMSSKVFETSSRLSSLHSRRVESRKRKLNDDYNGIPYKRMKLTTLT